MFNETEKPEKDEIRATLEDIEADCGDRGYELKRTASGYRFQVRQELSPWIDRLWEEKPRKYSRAVLETLALIAYRQPVTRGDVEQVRGVAVSSEMIRTLQEREWVRTVGHRDVPGRPALYATTRKFLDDFNLASLSELPPLNEIRDLNHINGELGLNPPEPSLRVRPRWRPDKRNKCLQIPAIRRLIRQPPKAMPLSLTCDRHKRLAMSRCPGSSIE